MPKGAWQRMSVGKVALRLNGEHLLSSCLKGIAVTWHQPRICHEGITFNFVKSSDFQDEIEIRFFHKNFPLLNVGS